MKERMTMGIDCFSNNQHHIMMWMSREREQSKI